MARHKRFLYKGEMMTVNELMKLEETIKSGIKKRILAYRLHTGWSVERAIHQPVIAKVSRPIIDKVKTGEELKAVERAKKIMAVPVNPLKCRYHAISYQYEKMLEARTKKEKVLR